MRPRLAITTGEPAGIGPEISVAALASPLSADLTLIGDAGLIGARAEALGVECKVGIATRAIRVTILGAGLVLADLGDVLAIAVYALAVLSTITVFQRVAHVRGALTA